MNLECNIFLFLSFFFWGGGQFSAFIVLSLCLMAKKNQCKISICTDLIVYYMPWVSICFHFEELLIFLYFFCYELIEYGWIFSLLLCDHQQWSWGLNKISSDSPLNMYHLQDSSVKKKKSVFLCVLSFLLVLLKLREAQH